MPADFWLSPDTPYTFVDHPATPRPSGLTPTIACSSFPETVLVKVGMIPSPCKGRRRTTRTVHAQLFYDVSRRIVPSNTGLDGATAYVYNESHDVLRTVVRVQGRSVTTSVACVRCPSLCRWAVRCQCRQCGLRRSSPGSGWLSVRAASFGAWTIEVTAPASFDRGDAARYPPLRLQPGRRSLLGARRGPLTTTGRRVELRRDRRCAHRARQYRRSVPAYDRMMSLRPNAGAYARAAHARELRGDLDGALEAMHLAFGATPPYDPEALAWCATQLGELREA